MKNLFKLSISLVFLTGLIVLSLNLPVIASSRLFLNPPLSAEEILREAFFYDKLDNQAVQCKLCPRQCIMPDSGRGFCGVRENRKGVLYTLVYAKPVAVHIDPIEKKPLFHFLPASKTYSVATVGCNLRCKFCQNWEISQKKPEEIEYINLEPLDLVKKAEESGSPVIAYTYTEPTIFYEYMIETAKLAKQKGIKNIMHSCGYINEQPLRQLCKYLDAANIDLKGFTDDFYAKMSEATLAPVLRALKILKEEGVHTEITNLILSGYNDDKGSITEMCMWIKENMGADTPLHFARAFPMYKLNAINPTPVETLEKARKIAMDCGLKYVYIGNVAGHPAENTYCPKCKKAVIKRTGITVLENNLENGKCKFCQEKIAGIWH